MNAGRPREPEHEARLHRPARPRLAGARAAAWSTRTTSCSPSARTSSRPSRAVFSTEDFGHKGKMYDGWETRRRREPGSRLGDRAARGRRGRPGRRHRHRVVQGQLPAVRRRSRPRRRGHPSAGRAGRADWVTLVPRVADQGRHRERLRGHRRPPVHPRPAVDLPRRRRGPVPRARRAGARPAVPHRHHRPGRAGERRRRRRLLRTVLLLAAQPAAARPGPDHGRGLGERPAPRRRQRPRRRCALAAPGRVERVEVDTSYFVGNAPGWASVRGLDARRHDTDR